MFGKYTINDLKEGKQKLFTFFNVLFFRLRLCLDLSTVKPCRKFLMVMQRKQEVREHAERAAALMWGSDTVPDVKLHL